MHEQAISIWYTQDTEARFLHINVSMEGHGLYIKSYTAVGNTPTFCYTLQLISWHTYQNNGRVDCRKQKHVYDNMYVDNSAKILAFISLFAFVLVAQALA